MIAQKMAQCVVWGVALACAAPRSALAQPSNKAESTLFILLKNGEVIRGDLKRKQQKYRIDLVEGGRIVMAKSELWTVARSLEQLYEFRARQVDRRGATAQFELAEWCLCQRLYRHALQHVEYAKQNGYDTDRVAGLRRRIEVATAPPTPPRPVVQVQPVSASSGENARTGKGAQGRRTVDAAARSMLSTEALHEFTTRIQPLLINRCGNASCHGRATTTEFRLEPLSRHAFKFSYVAQRNAIAVQAYIHFASPRHSPLRQKAGQPHGGQLAAALNRSQRETLDRWLGMATGREVHDSSASRMAREQHRKQSPNPVPLVDHRGPFAASAGEQAPLARSVPRIANDQSETEEPTSGKAKGAPSKLADDRPSDFASPAASEWVDPFDPAPFNRRHHGES